jgi:hypothetical protein
LPQNIGCQPLVGTSTKATDKSQSPKTPTHPKVDSAPWWSVLVVTTILDNTRLSNNNHSKPNADCCIFVVFLTILCDYCWLFSVDVSFAGVAMCIRRNKRANDESDCLSTPSEKRWFSRMNHQSISEVWSEQLPVLYSVSRRLPVG